MNFLHNLLADTSSSISTNGTQLSALSSIIGTINVVLSAALGLMTAAMIAVAIFLAFKFFTADDDAKRKNAKSQLIYAIVGVVVLIALLILAPIVTNLIKDTVK